jgi:hypothetical protein
MDKKSAFAVAHCAAASETPFLLKNNDQIVLKPKMLRKQSKLLDKHTYYDVDP